MTADQTLRDASPVPALRNLAADVVGLAGLVGILLLSARSGGGYFPVEYLTMGIAALVLASAVLLLRPAVPHPTRRATVALVALVSYGGWLGISSWWSPAPSAAIEDFQRTTAYAGILVLGLVVAGTERGARTLVVAVWAGLTAIAIAGVVSRLLPGLDLAPQIDPNFMTYRLSWPITYWNAQGAVAAMAAVAAVGIASDRRASVALRATAAATVPIVVLCILLAVSRGSILSLVVGVVVLLALARRPLQTLVVAACCAVPSAAGVLLATEQKAIVDDPTAKPALADVGPRLLTEIVALGVVAAVASVAAFAAVRRLERRRRVSSSSTRAHRPLPSWAPVTGIAAGIVVLLGLALLAGRIDGSVANRTTGLRTFIDTQRSTFLDPQSQTTEGLDRLGNAGGSRSDLFGVAIDQFQGDPVVGAGGGAFPIRWLRDRETPQPVQNAHSLPLEALAETGLVGFGLLAAVIGAIVWGAVLARRRPSFLSRSRAAGASAAIAAFLTSCAIDWTWEMGSLAAAMLLLSAPLLGTAAGRRRRSAHPDRPDDGARRGTGRHRRSRRRAPTWASRLGIRAPRVRRG